MGDGCSGPEGTVLGHWGWLRSLESLTRPGLGSKPHFQHSEMCENKAISAAPLSQGHVRIPAALIHPLPWGLAPSSEERCQPASRAQSQPEALEQACHLPSVFHDMTETSPHSYQIYASPLQRGRRDMVTVWANLGALVCV